MAGFTSRNVAGFRCLAFVLWRTLNIFYCISLADDNASEHFENCNQQKLPVNIWRLV